MTDIQLPDLIRDLFAAFDIADLAQILVLLLGAVLALLLVLIILIAVRGRSAPAAAAVPASASVPDKTEPPVLSRLSRRLISWLLLRLLLRPVRPCRNLNSWKISGFSNVPKRLLPNQHELLLLPLQMKICQQQIICS